MTGQWLLDHLVQSGHVTESGLTRKARVRSCPGRCGQQLLSGLDDPATCALEVRVDPVPLSPLGEALAVVEGRYTVALHREAGRLVLDPRSPYDIAARPAGTGDREDVMRQHRCGDPPPTGALAAPSTHPEAGPQTPVDDEPPF